MSRFPYNVLEFTLVLFVFAALHLPFGTRPSSGPDPRTGRLLERIGRIANLLLPGALWLFRGRLGAGTMTQGP